MTDIEFKEFKMKLMEDSEYQEFIRNAFLEAVQRMVSIRVDVETDAKRCPICHRTMKMRVSTKDGSYFWGCSDYPKCRGIVIASDADVLEYERAYPSEFSRLKVIHDDTIASLDGTAEKRMKEEVRKNAEELFGGGKVFTKRGRKKKTE